MPGRAWGTCLFLVCSLFKSSARIVRRSHAALDGALSPVYLTLILRGMVSNTFLRHYIYDGAPIKRRKIHTIHTYNGAEVQTNASWFRLFWGHKKAERGVKSGAEGVDKSPKEPSSKQTPSTLELGTKRCGSVSFHGSKLRDGWMFSSIWKACPSMTGGSDFVPSGCTGFFKRESVTVHGNSRKHALIHDSQHLSLYDTSFVLMAS